MAIGIKKYGDNHIYTVLSYDDIPDDLYYCCVKFEPEYPECTHPNRVNLADNDWERIDRHEVEHFARDWSDLLLCFPELNVPFEKHPDIPFEAIDKALASLTKKLPEKGMVTLEDCDMILLMLKKHYRTYYIGIPGLVPEECPYGKVAEKCSKSELTAIRDIWNRTMFVQPHLILEHIQIINLLKVELSLEQ